METQKLSYSQITTHRQCPQRYKYSYIDLLERGSDQSPAVELMVGNWWHALRAISSIKDGLITRTIKAYPTAIEIDKNYVIYLPHLDDGYQVVSSGAWSIHEQYWKLLAEWWYHLDEESAQVYLDKLGEPVPDRIEHMNTTYLNRWGSLRQKGKEEVIAVEVRWDRQLPGMAVNPQTSQPLDTKTTMFGYIDEIYRDVERDMIVVRDHKTSKALEASTSLTDMQESQLQLYAWGVTPLLHSWGLPAPSAVAYDRIRTVAPKTPQITKSGKLSATVKDFDLITYTSFVGEGVEFPGLKKDGSGAGIYTADPEVIERLSQPSERDKWVTRTFTPVNINLVKMHLSSAVYTSQDIRSTKAMVEAVSEAPRNLAKMNCKFCDYAELCRAQMVGGATGDYDLEAMGLRPKIRPLR